MGIVIVADLFFLISMIKILRKDAAGSQKALKIGMAIALAAFLAGALQQMMVI
jgi:4-hydroxybenzoate polyprenyltransferase